MSSRIVTWDRDTLQARTDSVLDVYSAAMQVDRRTASGRRAILSTHLGRDGLRAVAAVDEADALIGIGYGYLGARGQWWHDQVRTALERQSGPAAVADWLEGSFEVCELHVLPSHHGQGLGRQVLGALLDGTTARTAVLSTPDSETRARGFYRAGGWVDLVRRLRFPGDPRLFAVLGLSLPAPGALGSPP